MRLKKSLLKIGFVFLLCLIPVVTFGQDDGGGVDIGSAVDWRLLAALAINSVLVVGVVQVLKVVLPTLGPGVKQVLALAGGPLVLALSSAASGWLGHPIDLSPIATLLAGIGSGLTAMGAFDVGKKLGQTVTVASG